ncbi:hypothetical protein DFH06DRAFT_1155451 [Mycena polygramma]|nr:hypothetical protein DFH06DRAFT_1155451 [Mycena polygramma]
MANKFDLYGVCICTSILIFFFSKRLFDVFMRPPTTIHRNPADIRRLLDPVGPSMDTLLRSRAAPNARLVRALGLTNTFVNADRAIHGRFFRQSRALLQAAERDWARFTAVSMQAVELALPEHPTPFIDYVGSVTLSTIIVGLLDPAADITSLQLNDVNIVTRLITDLWILSKKPDHIPDHLLDMLNTSLRRLIPDEEKYPNPLDFVVPTWETLHRVVAATIAEVHTNTVACMAFQDLNGNPTRAQFHEARLDGTAPSVENHICESLRLHPPVRHITRHVFKQSLLTAFLPGFLASRIPARVEVEIADIESAQRTAFLESDSPPDAYDAARFLREPKASDVLAFGAGPLKCAAASWAPMAAAVIVGAILNRVDGVTHYIVRGGRIGGREGWDGWMVRQVA